jgi:hypothetical protein
MLKIRRWSPLQFREAVQYQSYPEIIFDRVNILALYVSFTFDKGGWEKKY